jgi:hypothetical protein
MTTQPPPYTPPIVRRCYLCGTNTTLPRTADDFLLQVLKNGRSYNYCTHHWKKLRQHAPEHIVEQHRRKYLHEADPKNNIHYSTLKKIISELERMTATN